MPEFFDGFVTDAVACSRLHDATQLERLKAIVEAFESLEFEHDGVRHAALATRGDDLDMVGQQADHALLLKASFEHADRFRMAMGFLGPLGRTATGPEQQRAHDLIAPLYGIAKVGLELVKIQQWLHGWVLPCRAP